MENLEREYFSFHLSLPSFPLSDAMATFKSTLVIILLPAFVMLAPAIVSAECMCEDDSEDKNRAKALRYKLAAIASILVAGAIGVSLPFLGRFIPALKPENDIFFIIKAFAAGVILSTGFVHILPDAYEKLTKLCSKGKAWEFPWAGTVAMIAAIATMMIDMQATSYFNANSRQVIAKSRGGSGEEVPVHTHATHGHSHGTGESFSGHGDGLSSIELIRHRVISQVLELGIVVHSVIIGLSLGASESPKSVRPLVAALTFHQFFEGMGLGGCITQAKFKNKSIAIMSIFFSLTTPVGIVIGIAIMNSYHENDQAALIVEGLLNAAASGILIYMALVDLLSADFMSPKMLTNKKLQIGANIGLLLGAGCMSLLAKWA